MSDVQIELRSTLTCPHCGHQATETMPTDACQFFWDCPRCKALVRPKTGDCCVFCSYGDVPCPPMNFVTEWSTMSAPCSIGRQR